MSKETFLSKVSTTAAAFAGATGILLLIVMTILTGVALNGFVIQVMWGWFLVPLGLPVIGFVNAMGLGVLIRYLSWQKLPDKEAPADELTRNILTAIFYPFSVVGLGFVIQAFM